MHKLQTILILALLTALPARGEAPDSLQILVQQGDSCMLQYNTFEALKHYQNAYALAKTRSQQQAVEHLELPLDRLEQLPQEKQDEIIERLKTAAEKSAIVDCKVQMKLADCYYKRANYREAADLLKLIPEDSLSHEAFRELALSYQKQGDTDSYIYWTERLTERYPMDGEMVAGLILALAKNNQPQRGIICGMIYSQRDSTNILVNRALADAWFINRDFAAASKLYDRLLQQGDSTFNTLYSAGMAFTRIDSLERAYQCLLPAVWLSQMQHPGAAYRLGVVCVDTKRFDEGLQYLDIATELMKPDTTMMKAITLSKGEGYYLTADYAEAVTAWKEHLAYNPGSVATYYNIANAYAYLLHDDKQAKAYYQQFLERAQGIEKPTQQLLEMKERAKERLAIYEKNFGKMTRKYPSERIDTVIPKFLSNGYFFREMPKLPDGEKSIMRLKDKEGNSLVVINVNTTLPKSLIRKAIPREQVHNADQFLNGLNMMHEMGELTRANVKADGTFYSPKAGEPFPQFSEKDMDGRVWTNDSVRGRVMVLNLWYSGCGPCRAEMPELSTWKELLPNVMFFSATYHDAELAKRITDKHHFTWTHLVEAKDMMSWIGTEGFPFTVVVDKQGIVRYAVHGTSEEKRAELLAKIKEANGE